MAQQVIIIEPDIINAEGIAGLLKSQIQGIEISIGGEVKSSLKKLIDTPPDLVLISCALTEIELTEVLEKTHGEIPVIILIDDQTSTEECQKLISRGLTSYIRVPLNEKDLFAVAGMALQNKKLKDEIRYQGQLLKLIRKLDSKFINIKSDLVDEAINESLSEIGKFTSVDRVYLFDYHFDKNITSNTHEWCASGISKEIENLQDVPLNLITEWIATHKKGKAVYLPRVKSLDKDDTHRKMLEPQNIQSILTIPLFFENECFGFVGFDSCREERKWEDDEVSVLQLFADLMTNLKIKKKFTSRLFEVESIYRFIANNINDAVALIDFHGNYTFISPSHKNLTGRGEEIIGVNAFQFIHPEDYRQVLSAVLKAKKSNLEYRVEYRYMHADKGYIWVESLGKKHLDDEGNIMGLFATRNIHDKKISQDALYET